MRMTEGFNAFIYYTKRMIVCGGYNQNQVRSGYNSRSEREGPIISVIGRHTGLPFGPSSPGGPLGPAGPAAPGGPASPFSPLSPLGP